MQDCFKARAEQHRNYYTKFCGLLLLIFVGTSQIYGQAAQQKTIPQEVVLETEDGIKIYADIFRANDKKSPLVLLFHQGDGNARGEYGAIIPRLVEKGYNVIAADQRTGGNLFGSTNRTVEKLNGREYSYCDAYKDLETVLKYAKKTGFTGKRIAWGSSYSATLSLRLANEYPNDIAGVLAFSPAQGEPMKGCEPDTYIPKLKVPALALRPSSEMERETAKKQFQMFEKYGHQTYIAQNGVHGSSMLASSRVKGDVEENWIKVFEFINKVLAAK